MALADIQQLLNDLVSDQDDAVAPDVRDRAIAEALVRYDADLSPLPGADVPQAHRLPVAQYAAYLLCQQLATRYSSDRDSTLAVNAPGGRAPARACA